MAKSMVREQIELLRSQDPIARLQGVNSLGKMGSDLRAPGPTLSPDDQYDAVIGLAQVLRDPESPIRAEAAWALGRVGSTFAVRRLLLRLDEILSIPTPVLAQGVNNEFPQEEPNVIASLIAAIGENTSEQVLQDLDRNDLEILKQRQKVFQERVRQETNRNLRVALIEMLVALNVRAKRAGLELFTDLTDLLCKENSEDSVVVLTAISLLKETQENASEIASRWHNQLGRGQPDSETKRLLKNWHDDLGKCAPKGQKLLEWLDVAAIIWSIRDAAQVA